MKLRFAHEPLIGLLDDGIEAMIHNHWQEVGVYLDERPLLHDWDRMLELNESGQYKFFVVRADEKLIGYVSYCIFPHLHYAGMEVATDGFYMNPRYRRGLLGYKMLKFWIAQLPRPCSLYVVHKINFKDGRVGRLLERLGLKPDEVVHSAILS